MPRPRVLLIDDGELDDVLELLRGLDIEPIRASDPGPAQQGEERADLLVASASTALALWPRWSAPDSAAVTIAITQSESKTLCASLRRLGFDYLVRRPVHPEALRLLLHSSLYRNDDRRGAARLPAGCEVTWFEGWQRRSGTLLELSSGGCRLIPKRRIAPRSRLCITLPRSVAGWPWLRLKGQVTRTVRDDSRHGMLSVAVVFGDLSSRARLRLDALLEELRLGPVALSDASPAQDAETVSSSDESSPGDETTPEDERRLYPRGEFPREVLAMGPRSEGVRNALVGRDLSVGGLRVEADPTLEMDDIVHIALYDTLNREPITVTARVVRDEGERGLGLRFIDLDVAASEQVQRIVGTLPVVEDLSEEADAEGHYSGVFLAEILDEPEGEAEKEAPASDGERDADG